MYHAQKEYIDEDEMLYIKIKKVSTVASAQANFNKLSKVLMKNGFEQSPKDPIIIIVHQTFKAPYGCIQSRKLYFNKL